MKGERSRDQAALDAPMLSQGTNQARRGSRKRRRGLVFLRNADGGPLFDSFVHLLGGEQRPDRHVSPHLADMSVSLPLRRLRESKDRLT